MLYKLSNIMEVKSEMKKICFLFLIMIFMMGCTSEVQEQVDENVDVSLDEVTNLDDSDVEESFDLNKFDSPLDGAISKRDERKLAILEANNIAPCFYEVIEEMPVLDIDSLTVTSYDDVVKLYGEPLSEVDTDVHSGKTVEEAEKNVIKSFDSYKYSEGPLNVQITVKYSVDGFESLTGLGAGLDVESDVNDVNNENYLVSEETFNRIFDRNPNGGFTIKNEYNQAVETYEDMVRATGSIGLLHSLDSTVNVIWFCKEKNYYLWCTFEPDTGKNTRESKTVRVLANKIGE